MATLTRIAPGFVYKAARNRIALILAVYALPFPIGE